MIITEKRKWDPIDYEVKWDAERSELLSYWVLKYFRKDPRSCWSGRELWSVKGFRKSSLIKEHSYM